MEEERELYLISLINKYLIDSKGIVNINEYNLVKQGDLSQKAIDELKNYLINKYGTLSLTKYDLGF